MHAHALDLLGRVVVLHHVPRAVVVGLDRGLLPHIGVTGAVRVLQVAVAIVIVVDGAADRLAGVHVDVGRFFRRCGHIAVVGDRLDHPGRDRLGLPGVHLHVGTIAQVEIRRARIVARHCGSHAQHGRRQQGMFEHVNEVNTRLATSLSFVSVSIIRIC